MQKLLYPFSVIYNLLSEFNRKNTRAVKLYKPVISIGNVTWGGSGKTPVVIETAKYILSLQKTPVILSRGYRRKTATKESIAVRNREKILSTLEMSGDEPYMTAQKVECPVIIGADRVQSAELAKKFSPDVFILDDGFQHWRLKRDLDVVCINAGNPFGNGMIIPAGILREKLTSLKRAGIIIITNCDSVGGNILAEIQNTIYSITGKQPLLAKYGDFKIKNISETQHMPSEFFQNKKFFMVCAIGSPSNFRKSIEKLGFTPEKEFVFRDHHEYLTEDMASIFRNIGSDDIIITTEKDAIKIKDVVNQAMAEKIFVLVPEIVFVSGRQELDNKIRELIK